MQNATLSRVEIDEQALTDPLHYAMASRDADVMTLVADALASGRARLAFHPIITADANPRVAFYEGLVRLMDDAGRVIPAAHFMPLIEETGMGRQIDCVTLDLALKFLRQHTDIRLSVNVAPLTTGCGIRRGLVIG
jgi:EAL domain-containing protein (putative c-di-GMP-specific phosphodiesterase class I)